MQINLQFALSLVLTSFLGCGTFLLLTIALLLRAPCPRRTFHVRLRDGACGAPRLPRRFAMEPVSHIADALARFVTSLSAISYVSVLNFVSGKLLCCSSK